MKILSFGEIIWDLYGDRRVIGGAPLNFAGHCAMGGHEAFLLSAVGQDRLGNAALAALADLGIGSDFVLENGRETGQCIVSLDEKGIPSYRVLTDTAYDNISGVDTVRLNAARVSGYVVSTVEALPKYEISDFLYG